MADVNFIEDIEFDQSGNNGNSGGENSGGGGTPNGGGSNNVNSPDETFATTYNIYIKSNVFEASLFINGQNTYKFIPHTFQVTKEQLFTGGPITIQAKCEGYSNNEKYILSLGFPNEDGNNPQPVRVDGEVVGLSTAYLKVDYDNGLGQRITLNTKDSGTNSRNLEFSFERKDGPPPRDKRNTFQLSYSGNNGIRVVKNDSVVFYPEKGQNFYSDIPNTNFLIESRDSTLYRISYISVSINSDRPEIIQADKDESLSIKLKLDGNYNIKVVSENVPEKVEWVEPRVKLVNTNLKPYNINSKSDYPILLRRNSAVTGVTVIVGDNLYEFKNIPNTPTFGIEIPGIAFEQVANYNVRVVPFLLSEGRPVRPDGDNIEIVDISLDDSGNLKDDLPNKPTQNTKPKEDFIESEKVVPQLPDNPYNPYLSPGDTARVVSGNVLRNQVNQK